MIEAERPVRKRRLEVKKEAKKKLEELKELAMTEAVSPKNYEEDLIALKLTMQNIPVASIAKIQERSETDIEFGVATISKLLSLEGVRTVEHWDKARRDVTSALESKAANLLAKVLDDVEKDPERLASITPYQAAQTMKIIHGVRRLEDDKSTKNVAIQVKMMEFEESDKNKYIEPVVNAVIADIEAP